MSANRHKYRVGQSVRYDLRGQRSGSNASYKIVQLLPADQGFGQYRIKSVSETHERIARENEIRLDH